HQTLIVLSELSLEKDRQLAESFPKISLIIGSRDQAFTQKPIDVGTTRIVQTSYRNQYLGVVTFPGAASEASLPLAELVGLEESLEKSPDPKLKRLITEWKSKSQKLVKITEEKSAPRGPFQTFVSCVQCHEPAFKFWLGTSHAHALKPLEEKDHFSQPQCLTCHTLKTDRGALTLQDGKKLGWKEHSSFMESLAKFSRDGTPPPQPAMETIERAWGAVQCENCHGAAGNHPFEGNLTKAVADTTCLKCHTEERAPSWYTGKQLKPGVVSQKKKLIRCPADITDEGNAS
ncbi:MAG: hypothetical protein EOP09_13300, partial [Proteobacteria bacterium]